MPFEIQRSLHRLSSAIACLDSDFSISETHLHRDLLACVVQCHRHADGTHSRAARIRVFWTLQVRLEYVYVQEIHMQRTGEGALNGLIQPDTLAHEHEGDKDIIHQVTTTHQTTGTTILVGPEGSKERKKERRGREGKGGRRERGKEGEA
jgi:hypothetical protein